MNTTRVNNCPVPKGKLVIIGGKENKGDNGESNGKNNRDDFKPLEVLESFVREVSKEDPLLEIITTATSTGDESFNEYRKCFEELGIHRIGHMHHNTRSGVQGDELLQRINAADAFFFSGGDQLKLTALYGGTFFLTRLKERYISDNITIGGTSAGAMAMSTPMIYAGSEEVQELGGEIKVTTGLEFLKDTCIDTHFVHRGRFVRLAQVIATNPTCIGAGIEEDTALIVRNGIETEVVGSGTIIIIDGAEIERSNIEGFTEKVPITIRNIKVHILSKGEKYTLCQRNPPHI